MINISNAKSNREQEPKAMALFQLAFRPLFLFGALFSIIALLVWGGVLSGKLSIDLYGGGLFWHMHEMLFGFVAAIIVGFLLTAVQNWTGVRSLNGKGLMLLLGIWLLARVLPFFNAVVPSTLIAFIDLLFLPLAAASLAYSVLKVKLWRNLMFVPILLLMTIANGVMHYGMASQNLLLASNAANAMVMLVTLVMCIMGGRVFPMFTANGTQTPKVEGIAWLEKLAIFSVVLAVLLSFNFLPVSKEIIAVVFIFAGVMQFARAIRWRFWVTLKTPLVWSLHLSYFAIAFGLCSYGFSLLDLFITHSQAIHALTIGAMGMMILSMISRVSLGHTGRMIVVGKVMTTAFIALFLSFIVRVFGSFFIEGYQQVIYTAIGLWSLAYGCFFVLYLPILTTPRK